MTSPFSFINEQTFLYFTLTLFILACFRGCLLRIPYATIISTLISTCGLIIGLASLFDATTILERLSYDLLSRNYLILNDLKVGYIFAALFIIIVIFFNLVIGFVATDQSLYRAVDSPSHHERGLAQSSGCCAASSLRSSTAVCLLQTFLAFNYIIYYLLLAITIISFIALYTTTIGTVLCRDAPIINLATTAHSRIPNEDIKTIDLRQFATLINLNQTDRELLVFNGPRYQKLCSDYVSKLHFHLILCTLGFLLACAGFVNYLINFSVNAAKLSTKQKFSELIYLNSEMSPFDGKY